MVGGTKFSTAGFMVRALVEKKRKTLTGKNKALQQIAHSKCALTEPTTS